MRDTKKRKEIKMNDWEIIYKHDKPYGIRNTDGFLLFFSGVSRYSGQEERYKTELAEQARLAKIVLAALEGSDHG